MTVSATLLRRLAVLEEARAAMKPPRPAREITDAMTIAEIQDAWQRELEQANASTAGTSPAEVRDPAELDRLAAEFAESIGATLEGKPTKAAELDDGEKLRALLRNRDGPRSMPTACW